MGLPKVNINVTGEIVRPALNTDGVTGFVFYNDNIADLTTFSGTNRVVKFTNLSAIEATGITSTSTNFKLEHYQLSEYFRLGGQSVYVGIFDVPAVSFDYTELDSMYLTSDGEIKQYAVYDPQALDVANIALVQSIVAAYDADKKPAIALYSAQTSAIAFASLPDVRSLAADAPNVSLVSGQDSLSNVPTGFTNVPNLGAVTGAVSSAKVSQNVLEVGKYNYTDGSEMVEPGFLTSEGFAKVNTFADADLDALNDKGHIFYRFLPNLSGTYLSNDNNCNDVTGTFNSIHIMRTRNKTIRELDKSLSPLIGTSLSFNADGTLTTGTVGVFENAAASALRTMLNNGEISAFDVFVDPTQDSLTSKSVTVQASIVPIESADNITINVAFVQSI